MAIFPFQRAVAVVDNFVRGVGGFVIDQAVLKDNKHKNDKLKPKKTLSNSQLKVGRKSSSHSENVLHFQAYLTARCSQLLNGFSKFGQTSQSSSDHTEKRTTLDRYN